MAGLATADADHTPPWVPYSFLQQPLSGSSLVTMSPRGSPAADAAVGVAADENRSTSIVLIANAILSLDIRIVPLWD